MSLITIAILGFIVGALTNVLPLLGSSLFNFMLGVLIVSYQQLAQEVISLPLIPTFIYVFALAYFVGTFAVKILSLVPIPIIQPIALMLRGTEP